MADELPLGPGRRPVEHACDDLDAQVRHSSEDRSPVLANLIRAAQRTVGMDRPHALVLVREASDELVEIVRVDGVPDPLDDRKGILGLQHGVLKLPLVKPRAYDARGRRAEALQRRGRVVEVAWRRFLSDGYAATTLPVVATDAKVSVVTVYMSFGNKVGLLHAVAEAALTGPGPVPTMALSDEVGAAVSDPYSLVRAWAEFASQVTPRLAPIILLIRAAATLSQDVAELQATLDGGRLERMAHQARLLADRGWLREGTDLEAARDVMWAYTDPAMYDLLVLRRGWSIEQFRDFLADALTAALLATR